MSVINNINNANTLIVGANRGIGFGFVSKLLENQEYGKIYATYRDRNSASELIAFAEKYPQRLICLSMDVTDEQQITEGIKFISESTDKLHLVVNCVGLLHDGKLQPEKSLRQLNSENLLRYFQVNSISSALLAKHLLPLFRHDSQSIFACISAKIGSIGDNRLGGWYGYRASKAALNMFMRTVAIEYGRKSPNTIVVTLHPGTTDTRLSEPFQRNVPPEKLFSVERTVNQLFAVINNLGKEDSGEFFSWDGSRLPW
ncbi:SDR family NAD(P)-dependent oxidoreductase [Mastigocoleus testarum]|uniref:Cell-cell signaling protein n=1 Tax=Mastigocoleus testarum BC008 TaxID=371196 RepID=A0A0V7ZXF9_9CYAN|nr:SDR family NAD(P)-dependent oxidoreductase [Mastigocoleus testarum]KST69258.1 cell-cell signaling protein [Mastigocoleus testarum BC008]KST69288.1 cell-cell signaling protein [Mastigocoleus testarum BC008]